MELLPGENLYMKSSEFIEFQVAYFKKHARTGTHFLGIEFEHFLIDRVSLRSYSYSEPDGSCDIVKKLIKKGWNIISEENGNPLGIEKGGSTITFEPGGQLEISLKPLKDIREVENAYKAIIAEIYEELGSSQALVSVNYHPRSRISDLPILPKRRYHIMYDYFVGKGGMSHYMMKGTAATQVSIDYSDEEDFIKKFRVANYIAPVISSIFDSSVVFEGKLYEGENLRAMIWNSTDRDRSKMVPCSLDKIFGFRDYALYLLNVPPIFIKKNDAEIFTGNSRLKEIIRNHVLNENDLEHLMSMVFPDIRVKRFIEMRTADSLPYPYAYAVAAMAKSIFCTPHVLQELYNRSLRIKDSWILRQNEGLAKIPADVDESFMELKDYIISSAERNLNQADQAYLYPFLDKIREHGSISRWLKGLYRTDKNAFLKAIEVPGR